MFGAITKQIVDFCDSEHVQVEWMIPLLLAHDGETATSQLSDFLEETDDATLANIFGKSFDSFLRALKKEKEEADDDEDDPQQRTARILEYFGNQMTGTLISFRMPVREYKESGGFQFTWGHCYGGTILADTSEQFFELLTKWVNDRVDKCKAKKSQHKRK